MNTKTDDEVNILLSLCRLCDGIVCAGVETAMDSQMKKDFFKEVVKFELNVKTVPLKEYRDKHLGWCDCKTKKI